METLWDTVKALKLWQIGVLAAVFVAAAGGTFGVYTLVNRSGKASLDENQQLIPVQYGDLINEVSTNGSVTFPNKETLTFGTQGTVGEVLVEEGQRVQAGQSLVGLDAATVASLEKAIAQARINLRNAEDALVEAEGPHTPLDMAQAEATVASAKLAVQDAEDALAKARDPHTALDMAQAEATVASAKLAVQDAMDALENVQTGPTVDDIASAQLQIDSASVSLDNAKRDLRLAEMEWEGKEQTAQDAYSSVNDAYKDVFQKWLGASVTDAEVDMDPDTLLLSWGADLNSLFDSSGRFQDLGKYLDSKGAPQDDPLTRWSEPVIYIWLNFYTGTIAPTCDDGVVPFQGACIEKEMDSAWDAYQEAKENLDTVQTQGAKAIANAESSVRKTQEALVDAQEALDDLSAAPDPLEINVKAKQLEVAQANLAKAEEDLADLKVIQDPLEIDVKVKQLEVAQANLAKAEEDLAELIGSVDSLEVALRKTELSSAKLALDTVLQLLEGATLVAPLDGIVSSVNVEAGRTVNANTSVIDFVDPSVVEIDGIVDEIDVLFLREGQRATVTMDALQGQNLSGTISSIASAATNQQGVVSYPIRIRVEVPEGVQLLEGLSATAKIILREETNVLLVPQQALYGTFEEPYVRVMRNGRIEEQPIALGNSDDFWVVALEGLLEGEEVVVETQQASTSQFGFRPGGGFPGGGGGFGGGRSFGGGGQGR